MERKERRWNDGTMYAPRLPCRRKVIETAAKEEIIYRVRFENRKKVRLQELENETMRDLIVSADGI